MPIFEYVCEECGSSFEKLVRRAGGDAVACPSCGTQRLKQQFSTFAAHANGGTKTDALPSCPGGMCATPELCGRN
jgi:putative FmdB family regulatory protein